MLLHTLSVLGRGRGGQCWVGGAGPPAAQSRWVLSSRMLAGQYVVILTFISDQVALSSLGALGHDPADLRCPSGS